MMRKSLSLQQCAKEGLIRNQQVAGSIPAGGSMFSITYRLAFSQSSHLSRTFVSKQSAFATPVVQQVEAR